MERFLVVSGVLFWASLFLSLSRRWVKWSEWLTESPPDPDVHPSVMCTCVFLTQLQNVAGPRNVRLNTNPKCPFHGGSAA